MRNIKNVQASGDNLERVTGNSKGKLELFYHTKKDVTWDNYLHLLLKDIDMRLELVYL